ncbi:MAG: DDE-type integrase/transposase/recombinase [Gammaproteobacteria bacterium]
MRQPDQVWSTDITSVPMPAGFMYLVVILDGYSRYVLAREVGNRVMS